MTPLEATAVLEQERPTGLQEPLLAWPGWRHLGYTLLLSLPNTLWFILVYGGMDALTAHRSFRVRIYLPWELGIPLVPAMTAFYMSIYLVFLLGPFIVRRRHEMRALVGTLAVVIFCAGIGFLLFPADLVFPTPTDAELGRWAGLFHVADKLNLTYNLLPSLHVALIVTCVKVYATHASDKGKFLLWLWAIMIAASTVLTHQHYVLDVVTGWLLALVCVKVVFRRLAATAC